MGEEPANVEPVKVYELADFEPSNGHVHGCPAILELDPEIAIVSRCDCLAHLYEVAATMYERTLAWKIEALGSLADRTLVIKGLSNTHEVLEPMLRDLVARYGQSAPLVMLLSEGQTVDVLAEDEMRACGWERVKT